MKIYGQRDKVRALIAKYGPGKDVVCSEYAGAEERGEVPRKRNNNGLSSSQCAHRLWRDGENRWF